MKALIVDDNHSVRRALQVMLEALGHEVVGIAVDGEEAIQMYDKTVPEFLFLDVMMPNVNGLDALRDLLNAHPSAKVIIYTGGQSCQEEAYARGAVGYLEKPFGLSDLEREIGKVAVGRSGASREGTEGETSA